MTHKIVKNTERGNWPVYRNYCAVGPSGILKCTGRDNPESDQQVKLGVHRPNENHDTYVKALNFAEGTLTTTGLAESLTSYTPLSRPELFLEFAELADKKVTLGDMLDWTARYGVLGLDGAEGGPRESIRNFASEARKINYLLRVYEMATAPNGPRPIDVTKLIYLAGIRPSVRTEPLPADALEEDKAVALVADIVRQVVVEECYPELYRKEHGYAGGWGFESLVGAMYLQMMQLLTSEEVRRCKGPDCWKIIDFKPGEPYAGPGLDKNLRGKYKTRKDKEFCSTNCRVKWRYHNVVKLRRESEGARS